MLPRLVSLLVKALESFTEPQPVPGQLLRAPRNAFKGEPPKNESSPRSPSTAQPSHFTQLSHARFAAPCWKPNEQWQLQSDCCFPPQLQYPNFCGNERISVELFHSGNTATPQIKWITRHQRVSYKSLWAPAFWFTSNALRKYWKSAFFHRFSSILRKLVVCSAHWNTLRGIYNSNRWS